MNSRADISSRHRTWLVVLIALVGCGTMALVDGVWMPHYFMKSAVKLMLFLLLPLLYSRYDRSVRLRELLRFDKRGTAVALLLGLGVYAVILGGYFLLRSVFDFSGVATALSENAGVNRNNFIFVALYISLINSALEEFFFRGFLFRSLRASGALPAYLFSSVAFALYHIAMMIGWFSLPLSALIIFGLVVGGIIFNALNERFHTLYVSWAVHMFANFAINTIGFILLL
jgi:membrane protease YdiL (CAAX protease family)